MSFIDQTVSILQIRDSDYSSDCQMVEKLKTQVEQAQGHFDKFWTTAETYCSALQKVIYDRVKDPQTEDTKGNYLIEFGRGRGLRQAQQYAMPRQRIEAVRQSMYTNVLAELRGRFAEEGSEALDRLCLVVCPNSLLGISDDDIDVFDFDDYKCRFRSPANVDCPA